METVLNNVVPVYLEEEKILSSEVWNHHIKIDKYVHIIAPSGRGKSSLMQFMYGLRKEYTGEVIFDNQQIHKKSAEEIADLRGNRLSIVFQDLRLFPDHTAYENITVKRSLQPYNEDQINQMAERLGISNKLKQHIRNCSYGEQQRVAIIRALQQPFELLILDEPFSHLDENNSKLAMQLILEEATVRNAAIILLDLEKVPFYPADSMYHL